MRGVILQTVLDPKLKAELKARAKEAGLSTSNLSRIYLTKALEAPPPEIPPNPPKAQG